MARYIEDTGINQPIDVVSMVMEDYVYHHRFTRTDWNGEPVYCCRDSFGKERYLVWSYASGILHLEAWLKGAFGKETNLSGVGGGRSAKEYQKSLEELIKKMREHSGNTGNIGYIGEDPFIHKEAEAVKPAKPAYQQPRPAQPAYQQPKPAQPAYQQPKPAQPAYQQPKPAQGMPYDSQSNPYGVQGGPLGIPEDSMVSAVMTMGIIGIFLALAVPFMGLVLGIIGYNRSRMLNTTSGKGKTAKMLCTIAIVLSIIGFIGFMILPVLIDFL